MLKGMKLRNFSTEKDLGVIIDQHLKFDSHIYPLLLTKETSCWSFRRTMTCMDPSMCVMLFKALVRPHLDYTVALWNPHLMKHIVAIEKVKRRATKLIPGFQDVNYSKHLKRLNLPTLFFRHSQKNVQFQKCLDCERCNTALL